MRWSTFSTDPALLCSRSLARPSCRSASSSRDAATSSCAFASASVISYGRASIVKSRSPFRTMSPSLKNIPVSVPPTCARSSTCETAANWPRKPSRVSMSSTSGLLTTTCGSAAGGAAGELPLALGEYLSHAPINTIPARLAATHSFADVRPVIRRALFSVRSSDASSVPVSILLVLPIYCSFNLHEQRQKKSMRLFADLTNQIGQGYFCERSLEAVLSLREYPRHALLEVTADRTPLVDRIRMNGKRRWCRAGTVYVEQRDLSRRTRKHAGSALAAFCHHQARLRELGERFSNEGGVGVHTVGQGRRGKFLAMAETQSSHNVRGNRKLDAFHRHNFSCAICDAQQHNWLYPSGGF